MAIGVLAWYTTADVSANTISFSVTGGTPTAAVTRRLYNTFGSSGAGIDTMFGLRVEVRVQDSAGNPLSEGLPAQDGRWLQARSNGAGATTSATFIDEADSNWHDIGKNLVLWFGGGLLGGIPEGMYRDIDFRVNAPTTAGNFTVVFEITPYHDETNFSLDGATAAALGEGVIPDLGWDQASRLMEGDGLEVTPQGTPDNTVDISRGVFLVQGEWRGVALVNNHALSNLDSAAAALVAGESYIAFLSYTTAEPPVLTTTKGLKGTTPAVPDPPTGQYIFARVTVPFDATIDAGDITDDRLLGEFVVEEDTGLGITIGAGRAIVREKGVMHNQNTLLTLTDNDTLLIELQDDGTIAEQTSESLSDGAIPLAKIITSGAAITSIEDLRPWVRGSEPVILSFQQRTINAVTRYNAQAIDRDYIILRTRGTHLTCGTALTTDFNFQQYRSSWTSFYDSSLSEHPSIANTDTDPTTAAGLAPVDVYALNRGDIVAMYADTIATGHIDTEGQILLRAVNRYDL